MRDRAETMLTLTFELSFLEFRISCHSAFFVLTSQREHAVIERMETRESHELVLVTHRRDLLLELRDRRGVELLLPIERRRKIVREEFAREFGMNRFSK